MFYSRVLLARKAPLGQIWMAATTHEKINRKKLNKLNIIRICEEILNPSVPMALRLSGILMGGVVIVYERKVKLLYDDVNRLLVEINQAWKVKSVPDPTLLPKAKSQAKYEAITLPAIREEDTGEIETLQHSDATTGMGFTQTAYFAMRLDNMDDSYINLNPKEDLPQDHHQANADDITMLESYDPSLADTSLYNRFERFDIEGDDDTQLNFTAPEHTTIPSTLVPSPPPQGNPQADEILEQHPEGQVQQAANGNQVFPDQRGQGPTRRRARRPPAFAMDNDQTIIPGHIFQSWLQDTSDIASRRRNKKRSDATLKRKIANLMDLPPTVLFDGLFTYGNREVHFPAPLLELWRKISQPLHGSPSVRTSTCQNPEPSRTSPPEGIDDQYPLEYPFEDFHSGVGSQTVGDSIEMLRTNQNNNNIESEIQRVELAANTRNTEVPLAGAYGANFSKTDLMATPGNSSDEVRSIPSSGSGHGFPLHNSEINSARSNKKRTFSSSSLEPVSEENSGQHDFKLARLSENELMVETGPTQTQKHELTNQPTDHITDSIKMQLKTHFEKLGSPKVESLNQLARGMDRRKAAILFYQTCVLATKDSIKVHQKEPYGDIIISTGPNM